MKANRSQIETFVAALIQGGIYRLRYEAVLVDAIRRERMTGPDARQHATEVAIAEMIETAEEIADQINDLEFTAPVIETFSTGLESITKDMLKNMKPVEIPEFCKVCGFISPSHHPDCVATVTGGGLRSS
jgi:hypothetical protein